ncbi:MAG: SRPBCC family protein [Thermoproteota archaeon]|nr:SRPBCC family protein [Thermoproteota archaeon]
MTAIQASRDINTRIDNLWDIISNVDKDPDYWHGTRSIKNIKKEGNTIERETIISFKESKCKEIVTLYPRYQTTTEIIEGPLIGCKTITLDKIDENNTRINVKWDIHLKGFLGPFTIFVKKHILKGTEEALNRISYKIIEKQT